MVAARWNHDRAAVARIAAPHALRQLESDHPVAAAPIAHARTDVIVPLTHFSLARLLIPPNSPHLSGSAANREFVSGTVPTAPITPAIPALVG